MILYKELSWWYWAVTAVLLVVGLTGRVEAFYAATALSAIQTMHYRLTEGSFSAFPVQVRLVYTALLAEFLWPPLRILYWLPALGTIALVVFGYCPLARCLSLLPWNRTEDFSLDLVKRTFLAAPVKGNIMQGLPPAQ